MKSITFQNVWKHFDSKTAVADVSFEIRAGEVFGLLGPNGAGKTTLIRILMDIFKPDSGAVLYDGHALEAGDKDRITYLPEERGLYRRERVRDVLEYFAVLKGMPRLQARARVPVYLEKLEMGETANRRIEELSKGNQQKIQFASALVSDPELIVLDEPFSGLDPLNLRLTKSLLAEEHALGKTILLSTHQMNQVEELCDRLLMIHEGRNVLYGRVDEIVQQHSERAFLVQCDQLNGSVPEIAGVVNQGKHWKVYPAEGVSSTRLLKVLIENQVEISGFQKATTPLEEIFIKTVRAGGAGVKP